MKVDDLLREALRLSEEEEDLDGAEKIYLKALRVKQLPELWNNLGNIYRRKGLLSRAIECYKKAMDLDPNFSLAKINLGAAFVEIGRYGEASMILENALKSEEHQEGLLALAIAYEKSGRHADFIKIYRRIRLKNKDEILAEYGINPPRL